MEPVRFFDDVELLEPKCPKCSSKLDYGVTTKYSEKHATHMCLGCGSVL